MMNFLTEHVEGKFMREGICVNDSKDKLCVLVKAFCLGGMELQTAWYDSVTTGNCMEIAEEIENRNRWGYIRWLEDVMDFLSDAEFYKHPFLTAEHLPFVIVCARWAMEHDKSPESFRTLVEQWEKEKKTFSRLTDRQEKMQQFESSMKNYYKK